MPNGICNFQTSVRNLTWELEGCGERDSRSACGCVCHVIAVRARDWRGTGVSSGPAEVYPRPPEKLSFIQYMYRYIFISGASISRKMNLVLSTHLLIFCS